MTGWDSLKGEVLSSSTFSVSFMLESEGQSRHCVLSSQLRSQLAVASQPLPRAKSYIPFSAWPYLQGLWKGMCRARGSEKLERANVRGGVWLPGVRLGDVTCSWEPGRRLTLTFSKQPRAKQLASFFLSWQVGHKIDSAPRCVLWLRVQCSTSLVWSRAQARGLQAGLWNISAFHSVLVEPRERGLWVIYKSRRELLGISWARGLLRRGVCKPGFFWCCLYYFPP